MAFYKFCVIIIINSGCCFGLLSCVFFTIFLVESVKRLAVKTAFHCVLQEALNSAPYICTTGLRLFWNFWNREMSGNSAVVREKSGKNPKLGKGRGICVVREI